MANPRTQTNVVPDAPSGGEARVRILIAAETLSQYCATPVMTPPDTCTIHTTHTNNKLLPLRFNTAVGGNKPRDAIPAERVVQITVDLAQTRDLPIMESASDRATALGFVLDVGLEETNRLFMAS